MKKLLVKILTTGFILGAVAFGVSQADVQKSADSEAVVNSPQAYDPGDNIRP